jgi:hypothetical protein
MYCNWTTLLIAGREGTSDDVDGYVSKYLPVFDAWKFSANCGENGKDN